MKLSDLALKHKVTIQLIWGEKTIEFVSEVLINDAVGLYVSPYFHNDEPLELNVKTDSGVQCNVYTTNPVSKHRVSWKNVLLTTEKKNDECMYLLKTSGFNQIAISDDRRGDNRMVVQLPAKVKEAGTESELDIIVHDVSDVGISFYAPKAFAPQSFQFSVSFQAIVDEKTFNVKVDCASVRTAQRAGNTFVGCKIVGENKDYLLYCFLMRMKMKNKNK